MKYNSQIINKFYCYLINYKLQDYLPSFHFHECHTEPALYFSALNSAQYPMHGNFVLLGFLLGKIGSIISQFIIFAILLLYSFLMLLFVLCLSVLMMIFAVFVFKLSITKQSLLQQFLKMSAEVSQQQIHNNENENQPTDQQNENQQHLLSIQQRNSSVGDQLKNTTQNNWQSPKRQQMSQKIQHAGQQIISKIVDSFSEFQQNFANIQVQDQKNDENGDNDEQQFANQPIQNRNQIMLQNNFFQQHKQQIEHLNKTPFFGNDEKPNKQPQFQFQQHSTTKIKIKIQTEQPILSNSPQPQHQPSQQHNNLKAEKQTFTNIDDSVNYLVNNAIKQALQHIEKIQLQQEERSKQIQQEYFRKTQKKYEEDNQFISYQFGSQQKLEEVRNYLNEIKSSAVDQYIAENQNQIKNVENFVNALQRIIDKKLICQKFENIKNWRSKTPVNEPSTIKKDSERVNSAAMSQRMSSAQSQRLKSGLSKNSQNDQSFNLDLTVKTRNSKNPYHIGKMDSLMYSGESGFGGHFESPNKSRKAEEIQNQSKSGRKRIQDVINQFHQPQQEGRKSNLQKSYSQRVEHEKSERQLKRMLTPNQKIEQTHQNQVENEQQINQKGENKKQKNNDQQQIQRNNGKEQQEYQLRDSNKIQNKPETELSRSNKNVSKASKHHNSEDAHSLKKSNKKKYRDYDEASSQKQDTIVNRVENFDADDEDEDFNQKQKQVHESAHFKKIKHTQQLVRKRVETESYAKNKQLKKQAHNYSIKNIRRFNKVDFSKLQQGNSHQNSRINVGSNSHNNIFTTEINSYHNKISRLRQEKQFKKKMLQKQLQKINNQIKVLNKKQQQTSPKISSSPNHNPNNSNNNNNNNNNNNYASRVKISDNGDALKKAQSLVKNLRSQKRNRNIAKIGEFSNIDRNINDYMEELTKLRAENEQKLKQKKKIQILQRMKQNQVRKINEKKKITQNQQFVIHLKGSGPSNLKPELMQPAMPQIHSKRTPSKQRQQQSLSQKMQTPQLPQINQKKAYINKVRSFSVKKDSKDAYQQLLS